MDLDGQVKTLEKVDRDLDAGAERIKHQIALIGELARDGHDTSMACKLLTVLQESEEAMRAHRRQLAEQIRRSGGETR